MSSEPPVDPYLLCARLRGLMGERKITRSWLSEQTGISRPSLSNKLDGKVCFTYNELRAVIQALDLSWIALLSTRSMPVQHPNR